MRIIVVGCGKVGSTLVEQLSAEGHDIVAIDNNKAKVDQIANNYDVIGIYGNGASRLIQVEAKVAKADLLIATTSYDETNMLCCITAKKLGAGNTIARIRNPEYNDQLNFLREELGLSMHVNPEYVAAAEIFRILRFPSAQKIETFANGRIEMVEIRIAEEHLINGVRLKDINRVLKVKLLFCAVQRGEEVIIPDGDFMLQSGDRVSLTAAPDQVQKLFRNWGILRKKIGSVMIIGGSRIGYYLARMLLGVGTKVKIIDSDDKRCRLLCEELPKAMIIVGDGTDPELLHEEGINEVDAFVALTGVDEENVIVSMYATSIKVGKVVAKVNRAGLFSLVDTMGMDSVVSPKQITANMITQYVRAMQNTLGSNVETLHKIVGGRAEALEFRVRKAPNIVNIPLKKLRTKDNLLIAGIIRDGKATIPGGDDIVMVGDRVIVVTTNPHLRDLSDILK